jgi:CheY-like chemotaxis protein
MQLKILVIEDEDEIREIICEILLAEHYAVIEAKNGAVGIQLARLHLPDLIICDILMPEIDGYEVLDRMRQDLSTQSIPFIFLTAKTEKSSQRQGMELGADDYLLKPFTRNEILRSIATQQKKKLLFQQQSQEKLDLLRDSISHVLPYALDAPLQQIVTTSELLRNNYRSMPQEAIMEKLSAINSCGKKLYKLTQDFLISLESEEEEPSDL